MEKIYGYVCIGENKKLKRNIFFGVKKNEYEPTPFSTTLNPFWLLSLTQNAKQTLENKFKSEFEKIRIGKIELTIAENIEELDNLDEKNIVVIANFSTSIYTQYALMGDLNKSWNAYPAQSIQTNGLILFSDKNKVINDVLPQISRQGEIPVTAGNLYLQYID